VFSGRERTPSQRCQVCVELRRRWQLSEHASGSKQAGHRGCSIDVVVDTSCCYRTTENFRHWCRQLQHPTPYTAHKHILLSINVTEGFIRLLSDTSSFPNDTVRFTRFLFKMAIAFCLHYFWGIKIWQTESTHFLYSIVLLGNRKNLHISLRLLCSQLAAKQKP